MSLVWKKCFCNWINVTNICGVIRPFYYVAKLFGFAPFQLNDHQQLSPQDVVITNTVDCIIILFSLSGYIIIIFLLSDLEMDVENLNEPTIVTISRGYLYIITIFMSFICVIANIVCRKGLLKVVNDFRRIDSEVKKMNFIALEINQFYHLISCSLKTVATTYRMENII